MGESVLDIHGKPGLRRSAESRDGQQKSEYSRTFKLCQLPLRPFIGLRGKIDGSGIIPSEALA